MALTLSVDSNESISLEQFVTDVRQTLDPDDHSSLLRLAPGLRRLANDRQFLADWLNQQIVEDRLEGRSDYSSQVFELADGPGFLVRAVVWEPVRPGDRNASQRARMFMYQEPHDHNFSFLTVGYLGAGYQTTIYECDPASVSGVPGQVVDMTFRETTTLPVGKVMFYRAALDIHRQEPPAEYSISLNLLATGGKYAGREQHYFDLERKAVVGSMKALPAHPRLACFLARYVANEATRGRLDMVRTRNPQPLVRLTATESLASLCPSETIALWTAALADRHELVRGAARTVLDRMARGEPVEPSQMLGD